MLDCPTTRSGWYADGSGRLRWWDGAAWGAVALVPVAAPPPPRPTDSALRRLRGEATYAGFLVEVDFDGVTLRAKGLRTAVRRACALLVPGELDRSLVFSDPADGAGPCVADEAVIPVRSMERLELVPASRRALGHLAIHVASESGAAVTVHFRRRQEPAFAALRDRLVALGVPAAT